MPTNDEFGDFQVTIPKLKHTMIYHADLTLPIELLEQVADQNLDILLELVRITINIAG